MDNAAPQARDWALLPFDALSSIFSRIGAVEVLMGAGLACRSWLEAAKLPELWRAVDMENHEILSTKDKAVLCAMAKAAVDRSDGQLRMFAAKKFVTDELMEFLVKRSPSLTTLRLVSCFDIFSTRFISVMKESPLLELRSLELDLTDVRVRELTSVLESCPALEVLWVHNCFNIENHDDQVALRAKFARIKTMTVECEDLDEDCCDSGCCCLGSANDSATDSEDERTDFAM